MSLGHFILEVCSNIWSFLSDRAHKEYLYIFKKGERTLAGDVERGNAYVKEIVEHVITKGAQEYDPYIFEDKIYTWLRIPMIIDVEHLETFAEGLMRLHNEDSCKLIEKCGQLNVTAHLRAGPLSFNVFAWGKLLHIEQLITIKASLNHCKVIADFSLDVKTGRNGRLHNLCIDEFKGPKICISLTGFGYLSWFLSKFLTLITIFNRGMVRNLVEFELERYVRKLFPICQFPIEERYANSFSEDRSVLDQDKKNSRKCSNTNICEKSHLESDPTMSASIKATDKSSVKTEQVIANTEIHNVVDCNKEVESKVEIQIKEKQSEDSEIARELKRDAWYTNIPLLQGNEVRTSLDSETANNSDDNIHIDFKFSKDDVIMEDMEPLSSLDLTTCCVFVKYETENLQKMTSKHMNYQPSKHYKSFFKDMLKPNEESEEAEIENCSGQLHETFPSKESISSNKRSLESFFNEYPNFIALSYNTNEKQKLEFSAPNSEINSSKEVESCESESKLTVVRDSINASLPAESPTSIPYNLEMVERDKLPETRVLCDLQAETKNSVMDRVKNIESILKWTSDSENTEESKSYDTKTYRCKSNISKQYVQSDFSTFTELLDKQSEISNVEKEYTKNKKSKGKLSRSTKRKREILKNTANLRVENINESKVKTTCNSIEKLNVIGDEVCRNFENPWLVTIPESTFFFTDNESGTFSHFTDKSKRQTSELAEQPNLLEDMKAKKMENTDFAIDMDHILKKSETFFITQNKIGQSSGLSPSFQGAVASSEASTISQVVKNFFEQYPIDKTLLGQNIPLAISDTNENELIFSFSSKSGFSDALKNPLGDFIPESCKESSDVFEIEKFNLEPQNSTETGNSNEQDCTEVIEDNIKQSAHDTIYLNDSLYWSDPMFSDAGSISSNSDTLNLSSENSANSQDLTKNDGFENAETAPKMDSFIKNETNSDVSSYEIMNVDNELLVKFDDAETCAIFGSRSTSSNNTFDKQLEVNLINLLFEDASFLLNETLDLEKVKQAVLPENIKVLEETDKACSNIAHIDLLKETKKDNESDNTLNFGLANVDGQQMEKSLESIVDYKETYDMICADILHLLADDSQDVGFEIEDCDLEMKGQFTSRTDNEERGMSDTDVTEEFRTSSCNANVETFKQESLFDHCRIGSPDIPTSREDELEYGSEQAKKLEFIFENRADRFDASAVNPFMKCPLPYPYFQSDQGQSPWEECEIVDGEGRVTWSRALKIWGVETNSLLCPDFESSNSRTKVH